MSRQRKLGSSWVLALAGLLAANACGQASDSAKQGAGTSPGPGGESGDESRPGDGGDSNNGGHSGDGAQSGTGSHPGNGPNDLPHSVDPEDPSQLCYPLNTNDPMESSKVGEYYQGGLAAKISQRSIYNPRDDLPDYKHPGQGEVVELSLARKRALLDRHNDVRRLCANDALGTADGPEHASNMTYLYWDDALEKLAQERASQCYFGHPGTSQDLQDLWDEHYEPYARWEPVRSQAYRVGENVAIFNQNLLEYAPEDRDSFPADNGIIGFAEEGELYDWDDNICYDDTCGHWAQVCHDRTRYVGCAIAACPGIAGAPNANGYGDGGAVLVCNYWPAVDPGKYPFEDGLEYDWCIRSQQWDNRYCVDSVAVGSRATEWFSSGLINSTNDHCNDGLGRTTPPNAYKGQCNGQPVGDLFNHAAMESWPVPEFECSSDAQWWSLDGPSGIPGEPCTPTCYGDCRVKCAEGLPCQVSCREGQLTINDDGWREPNQPVVDCAPATPATDCGNGYQVCGNASCDPN